LAFLVLYLFVKNNKMIIQEINKLFERDLNRLHKEIESYETEESLWIIKEGIKNSGGNLALHLVGNLRTYIGKNLGGFEYIRNREAEFSSKNIPKEILLKMIEETKSIVLKTLETLTISQLEEIYKEDVLGYEMTTQYFVIHLYGHLNYHLGQINYHRRLF
jgi:Protein of unknown function (DUF1572)